MIGMNIMINESRNILHNPVLPILLCVLLMCFGCVDDKTLAPYSGTQPLDNIIIEQGSFTPRITWLGGYVTAFGVNRGGHAILDSTLQWLIKAEGNQLHYPVEYGRLPSGIQDLTESLGGKYEPFIEDSNYTYWIAKEEVWPIIADNPGKIILPMDMDTLPYILQDDTLWLNVLYHWQRSRWIDVFTNVDISSIQKRGGFAEIFLTETDTSNNLVFDWKIIDKSVSDTLIAAMGLCKAATYDPKKIVWEVWSVDTSSGQNVYGKNNVISPPILLGESFPGTRAFKEYPLSGLERNGTYLFWIAGKDWDGVNHLRSTKYHAYITFTTW
jgi:hypothetical protein